MAKLPPYSEPESPTAPKRTGWEKVLISTPVILTVIATILAGLSNSELNLAQYTRALAAQLQSKASDQWGYFQAKKLRGAQCQNTVDILQSVTLAPPYQSGGRVMAARLADRARAIVEAVTARHQSNPEYERGLLVLQRDWYALQHALEPINQETTRPDPALLGQLPDVQEQPISQPVLDLMNAIGSAEPESQVQQESAGIDQPQLDQAIAAANANSLAFSKAISGASGVADGLQKSAQQIASVANEFIQTASDAVDQRFWKDNEGLVPQVREIASQLATSLTMARQTFNGSRYDKEAQYCQVLAEIYEIEVRKNGYVSEDHRYRSREFFYGMLAAQAGVTIATFALAVRRRSVLWSLATLAGLAAISFAAYVYLYV